MTAAADPGRYHRGELSARGVRAVQLARADRRLSRARLAAAAAAAVLAWASLWQGWLSAWWMAAPAAAFAVLVVVHDRVIRDLRTAARRVLWHQLGLARVEDRWVEVGETGERFRDADHPYALDLDLFGRGSLFQLLSTARTAAGEETLARWLLGGADAAEVRRRQAAVRDLAPRTRFREDLYVLGADVRASVDASMLVRWATAPAVPHLGAGWLRAAACALAAAAVASAAAWAAGVAPGGVPLSVAAVNAAAGLALRRSAGRVLHEASEPSRELDVLAALVERVRRESFAAEPLRRLAAAIDAGAGDPARAARRLGRPVRMHDWRRNLVFAPIAAVLLWEAQCAAAVEAWRARHGQAVEGWLRTVGELEALASLASRRFAHPDDPFPELAEAAEAPVYEGEGLAHPILPRASAVANNVSLGAAPQLLVVSGSNMSGKTTLLRTVGVNAVLALAGAPVRARRLRIAPLTIGATLRVQDSLLAGRSRFYAEITRVRRLVEMAQGPAPLLFLFDELFHGTNSHDRAEGAHGVLRHLAGLRAVGLVTTHDLALAGLADRLAPAAVNVHFEDRFADGTMTFDYRLRPGRATGSNALALMAAVGLEVAQ